MDKFRRKDIEKELGKFFSDKHIRSKAYMAEVVGNFYEVDTLQKNCKTLTDIISSKQIKEISRKSETIKGLLNIALDDLKGNVDVKVSGQAGKNIAEGVYELAKCLEFFGIYQFRVEQLYGCNNELRNLIKDSIKMKRD